MDKKLLEEIKSYELHPLRSIFKRCKIYTRMKPKQKAQIVELLQVIYKDKLVGFCGDGANDCKALKKADVGLSIGAKETSLAAPIFTSRTEISTFVDLILEGRNSIQTNFQIFMFFTFNCITIAISEFFVFIKFTEFSVFCYIWKELITAVPLAYLFTISQPKKKLYYKLPPNTFIRADIIIPFITQVLCIILWEILSIQISQMDTKYERFEDIYKKLKKENPSITRVDCPGYEKTVNDIFETRFYFLLCPLRM